MRILLVNDDGVYAKGLWALARALKDKAQLTVVAPDREQSGMGTAITLHLPVRLIAVPPVVDGIDCYAVEGTPADSVILALRHVLKDGVDLLISGINNGPNLGNDVYVSGTVGAAFQGYFYRVPVVALSIATVEDVHFDVAAKLAALLVDRVIHGSLPSPFFLNINVPNQPLEKITGVEITRLGQRSYADDVQEGHDGRRKYYWIVRGRPEWDLQPGTDIWAVRQQKVSITPLGPPSETLFPQLEELAPSLFHALSSS